MNFRLKPGAASDAPLWLIASPVRLHQACLIAGLLALLLLALLRLVRLVRLVRTRHTP